MYVLYQDRMTVTIFDILLSLRPHLLLPSIKPCGVFIDEVDQNIDDDNIEIDYRYESVRLESFKNWPVAYVKPEKLAAAGFYFTGQGDIVKCFDCHAELCQWLEGDDPMMDHERLSPTCSFVENNVSEEDIDYRYESARLKSFKNWPVTYIKPEELAAAGFYFTGPADIVKCFNCPMELSHWLESDDPMVEHKRFSPTCRFMENNRFSSCENVAISHDNSVPSSTSTDQDVCRMYDMPETLRNNRKPIYPNYCSYSARLSSFNEFWDIQNPEKSQTKEELAKAGFYYTGTRDSTACFYCGCGIRNWNLDEDPWQMHYFWMNDDCQYLLSIKGQDYEIEFKEILRQRCIASLTERQTSPSRRPLAAIEVRNELALPPRRHHKNPQRDIENISDNIAALSIGRSNPIEEPEEGAACASSITGLKSTSLRPGEEHMLCRICYNKKRDILFMSCNHIVACSSCSERMEVCPVCRMEITYKFQVYYA